MADWTMCLHPACASASHCKRHKDSGALPGYRQSYALFGGHDPWAENTSAPEPIEACGSYWASEQAHPTPR